MILLIKLILAHFIGDFLLQPKSWVKEKETKKLKSPKFYLHILLHGITYLVILWDWKFWLLALLLMFTHGIIDIIKLYAQKEENKSKWFLIDQGLHIVTILMVWYIWSGIGFNFHEWLENINVWIDITAILFLTVVSSIIIQVLMSNWSKSLNESNDASLSNAGKYIGILERLFVFTFIVNGNWAAIGFLMAAKSVFRFGDLRESKNRKLTEYMLIGTLLSFGIAVATAMLVLQLKEDII